MDPLEIASLVGGALESVGAGWFLGGSLASSLHGEPRSTNDIDLVVDLAPSHVGRLARALGPDFEVDEAALANAWRHGRSWNIFFLPSLTKVDLFPKGAGPFDQSEFARRSRVEVRPDRWLFVKSPEDSVLRKLLWHRAGGDASARQWRDVVEVLRVSGPVLDPAYLDRWAKTLDLGQPLANARAEADRAR